MKVHLLFADRDLDLVAQPPANEQALSSDLEVEHLLVAMANGDPFVFDVARAVVLHSLQDPNQIAYRQDILRDCIADPTIIRDLYRIAAETLERKKKFWLGGTPRAEAVVHRSIQIPDLLT